MGCVLRGPPQMKLIARKHRLIDKRRALRSDATDASPPEKLSLAELMQTALEVGKEDIYDAVRHDGDSPELAETWTLPGDYRKCVRVAQPLTSVNASAAALS